MSEAMNLVALAAAAYVFYAVVFDRIRHINWRTAKWQFVAMYLSLAWWALGTVYFALTRQVHFYQLAGLVAVVLFIRISKAEWLAGTPERVKTDFGKLDADMHHSVQ